jgi:hypothetical protein
VSSTSLDRGMGALHSGLVDHSNDILVEGCYCWHSPRDWMVVKAFHMSVGMFPMRNAIGGGAGTLGMVSVVLNLFASYSSVATAASIGRWQVDLIYANRASS